MRIGILQTDQVRDELRGQHGDYPDMFAGVLQRGAALCEEPGLEIVTWNVQRGAYPSSIDSCDAYVITGSRDSVYDAHEWIRVLEDYVRTLHVARQPLIGICFGHQLVAAALGGRSGAHPGGWVVGRQRAHIQHQAPWMQPQRDWFDLPCSHRDQVVEMPPGATLLAATSSCQFAAFAIDRHIITFQGHPEFQVPYATALLELRRPVLGDELVDTARASLRAPVDCDLVGAWMVNFVRAQVDCVRAG